MGSGVTVAAVAEYNPGVIYVVEIEKEMVKAAEFFTDVNRGGMADRRVNCVITDGRHFIQSSGKKFDVIISEPSNPWISGIGNLFSDEFYRTARQKLNRDGVFAQWVSADRTDPELFKTVLKTFRASFPNASLWNCGMGHFLLIGYNNETEGAPDFAGINARFALMERNPNFVADLRSLGIVSPQDLTARYLLGSAEIAEMTAASRINSDSWPVLEFLAPRSFYANTIKLNWDEINKYKNNN